MRKKYFSLPPKKLRKTLSNLDLTVGDSTNQNMLIFDKSSKDGLQQRPIKILANFSSKKSLLNFPRSLEGKKLIF